MEDAYSTVRKIIIDAGLMDQPDVIKGICHNLIVESEAYRLTLMTMARVRGM